MNNEKPDWIEDRNFAWFDEKACGKSDRNEGWSDNHPKDNYADATIVLSSTPSGLHKPCIDLDLDCHLVPSRTEGHYHLYINKEVEWDKYLKVLEALRDAGIVEAGFVKASNFRKYSACRKPLISTPTREEIPF